MGVCEGGGAEGVVVVVVRTWCSALAPSAGLTSPTPVPSEGRFQASPGAKLTQPRVEEKDCEARPPHRPLLRRKGGAIFSISSALDAPNLGPEYWLKIHLDVSFW